MSDFPQDLAEHLQTGATSFCRCWFVQRQDGQTYGFTDHDDDIAFDGMVFQADTGVSASALEQTTGLSVDNTEASGALSSRSITELDIQAGRFDGAEITSWLINWADVSQRVLQFRGYFGEVTRGAGAFRVELRGLTEALNSDQGRIYQAQCCSQGENCVCSNGLSSTQIGVSLHADTIIDRRILNFNSGLEGFDARWFSQGKLIVETGEGAGLSALIKNDRIKGGVRQIELWEELRLDVTTNDLLRLEVGCAGKAAAYKERFGDLTDFRGFPHIPGEDWLAAYPRSRDENSGESLVGGAL